ncbi:uncharacterized protein MONBRDRAFT_31774 [Monosiga brevicollis MX1]|uniref:HID1 domain-containing protein n=1 Tax=Monosiga brevicollis TaxID=81824 RepID=A9UUK9_MONBE|nr:uncharacterized protein MONBRDRAFT_31774 [Monosiga brevicollis MX1]EDQ91116.1 predicted protein [Monosiga brevicollis MX1]|eukprot:XP_001744413.1 hypothetical protein [Monosiga brevicollis MX1]
MGASSSILAPLVEELKDSQVKEMQDVEFWDKFWPTTEMPLGQIFKDVMPVYVHHIKDANPRNLATLVRRAILQLQALTRTGLATTESRNMALNVIRLLMRLVPVMMEDDSWDGFWQTPTPVGVVITLPENFLEKPASPGHPAQRVKEAEEKQQAELERARALHETPNVPLYQTLLVAILDLLLVPGFTSNRSVGRMMPFGDRPPQHATPIAVLEGADLIWYAGVGSKSNVARDSASFISNRCELLFLLLACMSKPLYTFARDLVPTNNIWMAFVAGGMHRNTSVLLTSMFNCLLAYDPVGYGLPYGHVMVPDDNREQLSQLCGQVLCLLLDYAPPSHSVPELEAPGATDVEPVSSNVLATFLQKLKGEDITFVLDNLIRLLKNPLEAGTLPASYKQVNLHHELIVLTWRMSELNADFLNEMLTSGKVLQLLVPILYHINKLRADPTATGLLHVGVYWCLLLSSQRNFAVRLNKPYEPVVQFEDAPFSNGSHGDLLIMVLYNLLLSKTPMVPELAVCGIVYLTSIGDKFAGPNKKLSPLYECLLTIIVNVSPYLKALNLVAANKLVNLFQVFTSSKFLFANATNHRLCHYLLESFNNLIQYQFSGNHHLVYVIIRKREAFFKLRMLTLSESSSQQSPPSTSPEVAKANEVTAAEEGAEASETTGATDSQEATAAEAGSPPTTVVETAPINPGAAAVTEQVKNAPAPPGSEAVVYAADRPSEEEAQYLDAQRIGQIKTTLSPDQDIQEHFTVESGTGHGKRKSKGPAPAPEVVIEPSFVATEEWMSSWRTQLPLGTIIRLLKVLVPQVEKLCQKKGVTHEVEIIEFLKDGTLVGLLPVPPPIVSRKYKNSTRCTVWFYSFVWSFIFLKNLDPPLFFETAVKLFTVRVEN